jgi:hypothetical protein
VNIVLVIVFKIKVQCSPKTAEDTRAMVQPIIPATQEAEMGRIIV